MACASLSQEQTEQSLLKEKRRQCVRLPSNEGNRALHLAQSAHIMLGASPMSLRGRGRRRRETRSYGGCGSPRLRAKCPAAAAPRGATLGRIMVSGHHPQEVSHSTADRAGMRPTGPSRTTDTRIFSHARRVKCSLRPCRPGHVLFATCVTQILGLDRCRKLASMKSLSRPISDSRPRSEC